MGLRVYDQSVYDYESSQSTILRGDHAQAAWYYNPLFDKQTALEQRIGPTFGFKRNKKFSSAIGRSGAHRRKLRTTFGYVAYFWIAIRSIATAT
jgi:hypothetical protein